MLGNLISAVDRIVDLLRHRERSEKGRFAELVQPVFNDMAIIHGDYRDTISELALAIVETRASVNAREVLLKKRGRLLPIRDKIVTLCHEVVECSIDSGARFDNVSRFFLAIDSYFLTRTPGCSTYTETIHLLYDVDGDEAVRCILEDAVRRLDVAWTNVTREYAKCWVHVID